MQCTLENAYANFGGFCGSLFWVRVLDCHEPKITELPKPPSRAKLNFKTLTLDYPNMLSSVLSKSIIKGSIDITIDGALMALSMGPISGYY